VQQTSKEGKEVAAAVTVEEDFEVVIGIFNKVGVPP
jgi:hypothetical protein